MKNNIRHILRTTAFVMIAAGAVSMVFCYYMLFYATRPPHPFDVPEFHAQKGNSEFSVVMFSDCEMRMNMIQKIGTDIKETGKEPAFIMFLGDMGKAKSLEEWGYVEPELRRIFGNTPIYGTPGNHDARNQRELNSFDLMFKTGQTYWAVGDTLFITLNSAFKRLEQTQLDWLESVLKQYRPDFSRCVLMTHVPPIDPSGNGHHTLSEADAAALQKLTDQYNVNMVVSGHVHFFSDSDVPPHEGRQNIRFGKTRLVILPPTGQKSRNPYEKRPGYVRFDFHSDGSIAVEPRMFPRDDTNGGFVYFLQVWLNRRTCGFSVSLGCVLFGLLLLLLESKWKKNSLIPEK